MFATKLRLNFIHLFKREGSLPRFLKKAFYALRSCPSIPVMEVKVLREMGGFVFRSVDRDSSVRALHVDHATHCHDDRSEHYVKNQASSFPLNSKFMVVMSKVYAEVSSSAPLTTKRTRCGTESSNKI